tara:strand:- start:213 stop:632 length:420 start_codon:yes stop_codon:yes gene_type:complete
MNQNVNHTLYRLDQDGNFYWYKNNTFRIENPSTPTNSSNVSYGVDSLSFEARKYFTQEETNREVTILNLQREFNTFVDRWNVIIRYQDAIYPRSIPSNLMTELNEIGDEIGVDFSRPTHEMLRITRDEAEEIYNDNNQN